MKIIYITMLISVISIFMQEQVQAQAPESTNKVFGTISSDEGIIPFATISIKGTTAGSSSKGNGKYLIGNLPKGEYEITAIALGYEPQTKKISIGNNKPAELNFTLKTDFIGLEEVVISSSRNAESRKTSSVIVNSINNQIFEMTQSPTLIGALDFTPGLRTECNCQNCGFSQVRMNGLEGPYSQILINSRPIFSGLAGVYGLELFPANMVERIEVVRGGGSALYGGNAIAGTINIITKEPTHNTFSVSSTISAAGIGHEKIDNPPLDKTLNANVSIVSKDNKKGISVYGVMRGRAPYDENGDGYSEEVLIENQTFGFSTYYKPTIRTKFNIDFYSIKEFRRGGNKFDYLPHETGITEQVDHNITGTNLSFDYLTKNRNSLSVYTSAQSTDRKSYYGAEQDPNGYGTTNDLTASSGVQYTINTDFISDSKLITGIDHKFSTLKDIKLGANGADNLVISNQKVNIIGSYAQYEVKIGDLKLGAGLRYDNYNINDISGDHDAIKGNVPAPRANLLYNFSDEMQFRVSYASGYRAPQIFDEDLHIETSGARRITHRNSDNLKQETSNSYNASFRYNNIFGTLNPVQAEFVIEGFYTTLIDPFANEYTAIDEQGNVEYVRINAEDNALVYGGSFEANIAFSKNLMLQAGFTYQKSEYESSQQWGEEEESTSESFMKSPNDYGFLSIDYSPFKKFSAAVTGTYTGKMLVPHFGLDPETIVPAEIEALENGDVIAGEELETSGRFLNMGMRLAYTFSVDKRYNVELSAGMQNIFNQTQHDHDSGIYRDAGYIYGPHMARAITIGVKIGVF